MKKSEEQRENLRQQELKNSPTANLNDAQHRASNGSLVDLVGGLGWKGTGILLLVIIVGVIIYAGFFR
ncbi:DUF6366 family protein [Gracilibacillus sp. S3-1-1]|uniref:DUF6366 family protein n=1 Tax=Gracilibacillus pellucidus TaxID=3095368 RepID=A0ACC6M280_9BACI|nr:DUF6366 family protein [Gracilibacillus sp. S3-1-1]MDX8045059.1 DUF6366 family protein [Gracilibacillus sp. S3-1-1]